MGGVMQRQEMWEIMDADMAKAATALLPFTQPGEKLHVWVEDSTSTQALHQLAATIKQTAFGGELVMWIEHSRNICNPCKELVKELEKELHGAK